MDNNLVSISMKDMEMPSDVPGFEVVFGTDGKERYMDITIDERVPDLYEWLKTIPPALRGQALKRAVLLGYAYRQMQATLAKAETPEASNRP